MQRIKLLVVFSFALAFLAFRFATFSPAVSSQSNISAPTGFSATTNLYNNKIGLNWDTMRGATVYRIFRSTTNNSTGATEISTTALPFFFDTTATAGQTFFYWVRAENANGLTSTLSQSASGVRANTAQQGPVPPLDPPPPAPPANPLTATKAYLGKTLFWDEQLSSTKTVACGTCHRAATGGSDPRSLASFSGATNPGFDNTFNTADDVIGSPGVPLSNADGTYGWSNNYGMRTQVTGRKSNSFINAVYAPVLFWDGRATATFRDPLTNAIVLNGGGALESQAAGPPTNDAEMGHSGRNWQDVANRVTGSKPLALASNVPTALNTWINGRAYPELFQEVFGTSEVTPQRIILAIGTYERTLFSDQTPLDLANAGITPLPAAENRGRNTFNNIQCGTCHAGNLLTDNTFRNIGLRPVSEDTGHFQVTGSNNDLGEFRVPSLRNVGLRSSLMHNGKLSTLEDVVEFYNRGGDFRNEPNFAGNLIQPRNLSTQQKADLVAYLRNSLTDNRVRNELPPFDKPQLFTESSRVPVLTGTGTAGAGGQVPQAIASQPPVVGNPSFTVAVSNAATAANVVLVVNSTDPGNSSNIPANGSFARVATQTSGNGAASVSLQIPNNGALVGQTFFGRWYITDSSAVGGVAVSQAFRFTIFGEAPTITKATRIDFDGDHKTDISIFRPSVGEWWYQRSIDGQARATQFGANGDQIVPADFTGDGKADIAVWRPSTGEWFILRSQDNSYYALPFGLSGDIPSAGDFDADGKADLTIFRPSTGVWYIQTLTQGTIITQFGLAGDIPQIGDYDGDGKSDIAIYRPNGSNGGEWWINRSSGGVVVGQFGVSTDKPVAQDFTGDGKTDIAFWRPSTGEWFVLKSEDSSYYAVPFGTNGDVPAPGDYDGDGKTDTAIYRSGTWYVNRTTQGIMITGFGLSDDTPAPSAAVP